jgi:hypothetical protein
MIRELSEFVKFNWGIPTECSHYLKRLWAQVCSGCIWCRVQIVDGFANGCDVPDEVYCCCCQDGWQVFEFKYTLKVPDCCVRDTRLIWYCYWHLMPPFNRITEKRMGGWLLSFPFGCRLEDNIRLEVAVIQRVHGFARSSFGLWQGRRVD